jgi:hypothetical protein
MMHFIVEAHPKDNYIVELKFRTGEVRLLDMKPYIKTELRTGGIDTFALDCFSSGANCPASNPELVV